MKSIAIGNGSIQEGIDPIQEMIDDLNRHYASIGEAQMTEEEKVQFRQQFTKQPSRVEA